ncbi:UNVERIFIED_CONTAM: putative methyltransferase nsun6 [Gekko kuhli]
MQFVGEVIAIDKIADKVKKISQNAALLKLNCIKTFCYDSTKALATDQTECGRGGPPFLRESFDRILLDAPCSGMGQRPNMAYSWSLKEVTSYQPLQRKLFRVAVQLLKPGGTLIYSTCTITLSENEEQVAWALQTFPCLQLQSQVIAYAVFGRWEEQMEVKYVSVDLTESGQPADPVERVGWRNSCVDELP